MDLFEGIKTRLNERKKYDASVAAGYTPLDLAQYRKYNRFRPNGAKPVFCYLPFTSLTFSFRGQVFVCGYNRDVLMGSYPQNTIDEIWNGANAKKLREYMLNNDLDYGCRHCKYFFEKGKFTNLRPLVFDKYYENTDAEFPQVFEFELSNECNLECQMCAGEVSSSIRKNRDKLPPIPTPYDDAFVEQLAKYIPHLKEAKFYGGEPFLIPVYYKIWEKVKELNPKLNLFTITNGTHWNSKIERLINDLDFDLAVSIDAMEKDKFERIRKNAPFEKVVENIRRFSEVCNRKGKHLSLSFTVQQDNWDQFPKVLAFCNEVNAFIYVSYLERPSQFALASLGKVELQRIREYMNQFSFPILTQKERHNKRCFEDFLQYLDSYIENEEEKRYSDYRFENEMIKDEAAHDPNAILIEKTGTKDELLAMIEQAYTINPALRQYDKSIVLQKLDDSLMAFDETEKPLIFGMILKADMGEAIYSIASYPTEQLIAQTRDSLKKVVVVG